jgi:hypothetical protein
MRRKKGKRKWKGQNRRKKKIKRKVKGIMDISPPYPHYTAKRSCFAKCFPKTDSTESAPPEQLQPEPEPCQTHRTISFHANCFEHPNYDHVNS